MSRSRSAALLSIALLAACGSKTGLFGPEQSSITPASPGDAGIVDGALPEAGPDGAVPCVPGRFEFQPATAQLMFVVDRSGSMAVALDGTEDPPPGQRRWDVLRDGLAQALTGFDQQIAMGAKFYPGRYNPALQCAASAGVELEPKLGNAAAIIGVFDTTNPLGGTPTADALRVAADHVSKIRGVARTIVLATDGAPNCNFDHPGSPCTCTSQDPDDCNFGDPSLCLDDLRTVATVRDIADNQKVPVYVIGIGSLERADFRRVLDDMAVAGGRAKTTTPRYYSAQTSVELENALTSIRDSVGSCTFLTPSAPTDPDAITVEISGQLVTRDVTRTDGWDWVDQAYGTLALFGSACLKAQAANATVAGVVRCD